MKRVALAVVVTFLLAAQSTRQQAGRLFSERKYAEAATLLEQQLAKQSSDYGAVMLLGLCRQQLQDYAKAEANFIRAAALKPDASEPRYSLARVRFLSTLR